MNIALMAHDNKKELMVQFCTAYCGILASTPCAPPPAPASRSQMPPA